ncbi:MAG: exodeoxyribonuclease VII large subunit [Acidimicrobiales bacterium]
METRFSDEVRHLSLVRLSGDIAGSLSSVGRISVDGEVVSPHRAGSGRVYLTLRDRAAQISVACPASRARHCRTVNGERVRVTGRLEYLAARGQLQLVAEEVVPVGAGAIEAAIRQTRQRLDADGLLERPRRLVPRLPTVVGVVCGGGAAVRADIESVVAARFNGYPVDFVEVAVSGPGASEAVAGALVELDRRTNVEVIILARGGGDASDLLVFSDEHLCRAIATAVTPVVSAIGHDGDRPLSDEVADLRFGTPSLAASAIIPDRYQLLAELERTSGEARAKLSARAAWSADRLVGIDLAGALTSGYAQASNRLRRAETDLVHLGPAPRLGRLVIDLGRVGWSEPAQMRLAQGGHVLASRFETLRALDPARVLERGYAVVRNSKGSVVRDPKQVSPGEEIDIDVARGRFKAAVGGPGRSGGRSPR